MARPTPRLVLGRPDPTIEPTCLRSFNGLRRGRRNRLLTHNALSGEPLFPLGTALAFGGPSYAPDIDTYLHVLAHPTVVAPEGTVLPVLLGPGMIPTMSPAPANLPGRSTTATHSRASHGGAIGSDGEFLLSDGLAYYNYRVGNFNG